MSLKEDVKALLEDSRDTYDSLVPVELRSDVHLLYNVISQLQGELRKVIDLEEEAVAALVEEATEGAGNLADSTMQAAVHIAVNKKLRVVLGRIINTLKTIYTQDKVTSLPVQELEATTQDDSLHTIKGVDTTKDVFETIDGRIRECIDKAWDSKENLAKKGLKVPPHGSIDKEPSVTKGSVESVQINPATKTYVIKVNLVCHMQAENGLVQVFQPRNGVEVNVSKVFTNEQRENYIESIFNMLKDFSGNILADAYEKFIKVSGVFIAYKDDDSSNGHVLFAGDIKHKGMVDKGFSTLTIAEDVVRILDDSYEYMFNAHNDLEKIKVEINLSKRFIKE